MLRLLFILVVYMCLQSYMSYVHFLPDIFNVINVNVHHKQKDRNCFSHPLLFPGIFKFGHFGAERDRERERENQ